MYTETVMLKQHIFITATNKITLCKELTFCFIEIILTKTHKCLSNINERNENALQICLKLKCTATETKFRLQTLRIYN